VETENQKPNRDAKTDDWEHLLEKECGWRRIEKVIRFVIALSSLAALICLIAKVNMWIPAGLITTTTVTAIASMVINPIDRIEEYSDRRRGLR